MYTFLLRTFYKVLSSFFLWYVPHKFLVIYLWLSYLEFCTSYFCPLICCCPSSAGFPQSSLMRWGTALYLFSRIVSLLATLLSTTLQTWNLSVEYSCEYIAICESRSKRELNFSMWTIKVTYIFIFLVVLFIIIIINIIIPSLHLKNVFHFCIHSSNLHYNPDVHKIFPYQRQYHLEEKRSYASLCIIFLKLVFNFSCFLSST